MSRLIALVLAVAGTVGALFLPLYQVGETRTVGGVNVTREYRAPAGAHARGPIVNFGGLCILLNLAAVFVKKLQAAMGVCVLALALLGSMTIGMLFFPSAVALLFPVIRRVVRAASD